MVGCIVYNNTSLCVYCKYVSMSRAFTHQIERQDAEMLICNVREKIWDFLNVRTQKGVRPKCLWNAILVLFEHFNLAKFSKNLRNFLPPPPRSDILPTTPLRMVKTPLYLVLGRWKGLGRGLMHPCLQPLFHIFGEWALCGYSQKFTLATPPPRNQNGNRKRFRKALMLTQETRWYRLFFLKMGYL